MAYTTQKQLNKFWDEYKLALGLKSRRAAAQHFMANPAKRFEKLGWTITPYKDGMLTMHNYRTHGFRWFPLKFDDIFTPHIAVRQWEEALADEYAKLEYEFV